MCFLRPWNSSGYKSAKAEEAFCERPPGGSSLQFVEMVPGRRALAGSRAGRPSRCLTPDQAQGLREVHGDSSGDPFQHWKETLQVMYSLTACVF